MEIESGSSSSAAEPSTPASAASHMACSALTSSEIRCPEASQSASMVSGLSAWSRHDEAAPWSPAGAAFADVRCWSLVLKWRYSSASFSDSSSASTVTVVPSSSGSSAFSSSPCTRFYARDTMSTSPSSATVRTMTSAPASSSSPSGAVPP